MKGEKEIAYLRETLKILGPSHNSESSELRCRIAGYVMRASLDMYKNQNTGEYFVPLHELSRIIPKESLVRVYSKFNEKTGELNIKIRDESELDIY